MDISQFTEYKTGQVEPVETESGPNWAFVPKPLPETFTPPSELFLSIARARDYVGRLEQIKGILTDPFLVLRPLQAREALKSSSLEGTYVLPEELLLFDMGQNDGEAKSPAKTHQRNESGEVWNHYEALREGHNWLVEGKPLDTSLILHLHRILMTGVRGKDRNPGQFRDRLVAVGVRPRRFIPPPPDRIDGCIEDLATYMQAPNDSTDPLVRCFLVHYQFEAIHPFEDGNGRVGRVLLSLCASRWLGLTMPWLYLSEFFEANRRDYSERMFRISTNGEWDEWIQFCMQGTVEQSQATVKRCELLKTLRDEYNEKYGGLGKRMGEIVEMLFVRPIVSISQIVGQCEVSRETARHDLQKLVEVGVLREIGSRPKAFACYGIIEAAFGDVAKPAATKSATESQQPPPES